MYPILGPQSHFASFNMSNNGQQNSAAEATSTAKNSAAEDMDLREKAGGTNQSWHRVVKLEDEPYPR